MKIGFEREKVGITRSPKTIKMANTGNATLTISGITISGAFTQTNNCGLRLAAGANCFDKVHSDGHGHSCLSSHQFLAPSLVPVQRRSRPSKSTRAARLATMPRCREGAMSVSQTNLLDHVSKGFGNFGIFFTAPGKGA
jgi:hypothetical protein